MDLSVSGLASGFDWQSLVDQIRQVENQRVTLLTDQKTAYQNKLSAWQSFNTRLSTLQSAADAIKSTTDFDLYTTSLNSSSSSVDASSLLSATASSSAAKGTYQVTVTNKAQVEKLSSQSYTSQTADLGLSGTILVNGKAVTIEATDSLQDLRTAINQVNTGDNASGVVASVIAEGDNSYRLVLTSETEGADGISLLNGSSGDTLASLGFNASGTVIKNQAVGAARSDRFTSSSTAVESLLGNSAAALSGTVTINGTAVAIDLSDSLTTIKDNLVAAGLSAQVTSETEGTDTYYRLEVEGMTGWSDQNNVLQALGLIEGARGDVVGVESANANTTDGSTAITAATKIVDIYGYLTYTAGDKITLSGTKHDGTAVGPTDFAIDGTKTVGDLLTQIEASFGNPGDVTASVTSAGKIQVVDNVSGSSLLAVDLSTTLTGANPGSLDFGSFSSVGTVRQYVLQAGEDAAFTVDGLAMTNSTNTVTDAIPGVTLNLAGEDADTTVTVDVNLDAAAVEDKVQAMVNAYNDVIDFVNDQMSYDSDTGKTGGALFGDNTLKRVKNQLQSLALTRVGSSEISYLSSIGITLDSDTKLELDSDTFQEKLASNFDDVVHLLADYGSSTDSDFQYVYSSRDTQAGDYTIDISQASGPGIDVAGTIDGVAGSGSGDILKMEDSSSAAYGLMLRYTGTTAPVSTTFSFSRGIASLLEQNLYAATDSLNGTVALQETSLQTNMDALDDKIESTQALIDKKMDTLTSQFQAMEAAVGQMNALQSYLSSQLQSLSQ